MGLLQHLTLTQIYSPVYFFVMHQGLTQTWSLAVEFAFYAALPLMAAFLLRVLCKGSWRPGLLLAGLAGLAAITPAWVWMQSATDWLPSSAGMWLPAHLLYVVCGMALAVLHVVGLRVRPIIAGALAVLSYLVVSMPIAGKVDVDVTLGQTFLKVALYSVFASAVVAPLVLDGGNGYSRLLSAAPIVWLGESPTRSSCPRDRDGGRVGVGIAVARLHRVHAGSLRGHPGDDGAPGLATPPLDVACARLGFRIEEESRVNRANRRASPDGMRGRGAPEQPHGFMNVGPPISTRLEHCRWVAPKPAGASSTCESY
jgi:hypothetical protein